MRLRAMGFPRLMDGEQRIDVGPVKQLAILVYLACQKGEPVRRAVLTDLFWGDSEGKRGQRSLSQAIYDLRRRAPGLRLEGTRHEIRLKLEGLSVDVVDLNASLMSGDAAGALRLHTGRFLEGFDVVGSLAFREWRDGYAAGIESALVELLEKEQARCKAEGDWEGSARLASAILDLRPFDDAMAKAQLEAMAMTGERTRVLEMLEARNEAWQREFGEPLLDQEGSRRLLLSSEAGGDDTVSTEPPFVGRTQEFGRLASAWNDAEAGRNRSMLVIGQGGIGKSRICEQALRYAAVRGGKVFAARCYAAERRVALNPLAEALKTGLAPGDIDCLSPVWRTVLESYFPDLVSVPPESHDIRMMREAPVPRRLQEAVARLFVALSERQPVALFLDDVHWADESTTAVLHYLSRIEEPHRMMLLAALRPDEVADSPADALLSDRDDKTYWDALEIGEMGRADAETLIARYAAKLNMPADPAFVHDVYELAGGLPLFVVQVMRNGWRRRPSRTETDPDGDVEAVAFPEGLERFVREQLRRLSPDARRVLSCMAVVGMPMEADKLMHLSGFGATKFNHALEHLENEGVVEERAGGLSVAHGVIKDVVSGLVPASVGRRLHRQIAALFEEENQQGPAAVHYEMANDREATRRAALAAARQSEKVLAFDEALYFLKMARAVTPNREDVATIDEEVVRILLRERWYSEADRYLKSLEEYYAVQPEREDDYIRIKSERILIRLHQGSLPIEATVNEVKSQLAVVSNTKHTALAGRLLHALGVLAYDAQLVDLAKSVANELLIHARIISERRVAIDAYVVAILLIAHFESVPRAVRLLDGLEEFRASTESPFGEGIIYRCRAQVLQQAGHIESAHAEYRKVEAIVDRYALGPAWQSIMNNMAVLDMERGQYGNAVKRLNEMERYASAREANELLLGTYDNLAICHWETGDYAECARAAKQLQTIQEGMAVKSRRHEAWSMLGLVALRQGNVTEAKSCEREILLWEGATPSWYGDTSYRETFLARLAALEGNEADAMRRIRSGVEAYEDRDFFCRSRLQLEWARLAIATDPDEAASVARGVRESARRSGAVPLVESADRILDRLGFLGVEPSRRA